MLECWCLAAALPCRWDYSTSGIPSALTEEMEAAAAAKKVRVGSCIRQMRTCGRYYEQILRNAPDLGRCFFLLCRCFTMPTYHCSQAAHKAKLKAKDAERKDAGPSAEERKKAAEEAAAAAKRAAVEDEIAAALAEAEAMAAR